MKKNDYLEKNQLGGNYKAFSVQRSHGHDTLNKYLRKVRKGPERQ